MRTLVIGGTGNVGRELVKRLLAMDEAVSIMTPEAAPRHAVGTRIVRGDLDDPASVREAMRGARRVFLLLPQSPNEEERGLAAVAAAREAGVERLVYSSVRMPAFAPDVPHFAAKQAIERALRASGIPHTIMRPNNFFQNDLAFLGAIVEYGVYPQPIGRVGVARVDVRDIADAVAIALTQPGHDGRIYELNGPAPLTGDDVARTYSAHLGRSVRYAGDSLDEWAGIVGDALPPWLVHDLRVMYEKFQQHGMASTPEDDERLRRLLGRTPRSFDAFVAEVVAGARPGVFSPAGVPA